MKTKEMLPYEESAEHRTNIEGWVCKTCRRFWGDNEHMSRYCCAKDMPCKCGGRVSKGWSRCDSCQHKSTVERYDKLDRVDWDGESLVVGFDNDKFFRYADDIVQYCEDHQLHPRDLMLVLCEEIEPRVFSVGDVLDEVLVDEMPEPSGARDIEKLVNDWVDSHRPYCFGASNKAISEESLLSHLEWEEHEEGDE